MFELTYMHQNEVHFARFNTLEECVEFVRLFELNKFTILHWEEYEEIKD